MPIKAGSEIDAWCTKCRMDLGHRVVAAVAGVPKRVECLTCRTQHNYRRPKGAKDPLPRGTPTPSKPAAGRAPAEKKLTKKAAAAVADWEGKVLGHSPADFTAYTVKDTFRKGQLLRHKTFGDGYVADILDDNKLNVVFRDGSKILVHGRG